MFFKRIQSDLVNHFVEAAGASDRLVKDSGYIFPNVLFTIIGLIDVCVMEFYSDDGDPSLIPCSTYGDGNCLMRCCSMALFGNPDSHVELKSLSNIRNGPRNGVLFERHVSAKWG